MNKPAPKLFLLYSNIAFLCSSQLKVPTTDKPLVTVNFRKLLLNRCQKEFEKDKDDAENFEKKQNELDASKVWDCLINCGGLVKLMGKLGCVVDLIRRPLCFQNSLVIIFQIILLW